MNFGMFHSLHLFVCHDCSRVLRLLKKGKGDIEGGLLEGEVVDVSRARPPTEIEFRALWTFSNLVPKESFCPKMPPSTIAWGWSGLATGHMTSIIPPYLKMDSLDSQRDRSDRIIVLSIIAARYHMSQLFLILLMLMNGFLDDFVNCVLHGRITASASLNAELQYLSIELKPSTFPKYFSTPSHRPLLYHYYDYSSISTNHNNPHHVCL